MASKSISISLPEEQLRIAREIAECEHRTMSELVGDALQAYEKQRRAETTEKYRRLAEAKGLTEEDVPRIVKEWRSEQRRSKTLSS